MRSVCSCQRYLKRRVFGCVRVPCANCAKGCELLGWKRIMSMEQRNLKIERVLASVWNLIIRVAKTVQPELLLMPDVPPAVFQDIRRVLCNMWEPMNLERRVARECTFCEYAVL